MYTHAILDVLYTPGGVGAGANGTGDHRSERTDAIRMRYQGPHKANSRTAGQEQEVMLEAEEVFVQQGTGNRWLLWLLKRSAKLLCKCYRRSSK